jgi:hypothetical protein
VQVVVAESWDAQAMTAAKRPARPNLSLTIAHPDACRAVMT